MAEVKAIDGVHDEALWNFCSTLDRKVVDESSSSRKQARDMVGLSLWTFPTTRWGFE
ncbi:MAG TPA: hypothetical protein PK156_10140 [Polyangium sp.]|nr:hypothetical protein [Polyangium sp.]